MNVKLTLIAERLRLKLPYLRAEKNDRRMAHEFLERMTADGKKCFQKKLNDEGYEVYAEGLTAFSEADKLVISWGNVAPHSFDLVRPEATRLIDVCEQVLACFECSL